MAYLYYCTDVPDSATLRREADAAHLAYIETIIDHILVAGPLRTGGVSAGSCFVFDTDSRDQAERWIREDPYFKSGVWQTIEGRPFLPAAGKWIGGKIW